MTFADGMLCVVKMGIGSFHTSWTPQLRPKIIMTINQAIKSLEANDTMMVEVRNGQDISEVIFLPNPSFEVGLRPSLEIVGSAKH